MGLTQSDSIEDKFDLLAKLGAAMSMKVIRDANGKPLAASIFVMGEPEAAEVVEAVNALEEEWHKSEEPDDDDDEGPGEPG